MHFTATLLIPPTATELETASINGTTLVERGLFTTDLTIRLRTL